MNTSTQDARYTRILLILIAAALLVSAVCSLVTVLVVVNRRDMPSEDKNPETIGTKGDDPASGGTTTPDDAVTYPPEGWRNPTVMTDSVSWRSKTDAGILVSVNVKLMPNYVSSLATSREGDQNMMLAAGRYIAALYTNDLRMLMTVATPEERETIMKVADSAGGYQEFEDRVVALAARRLPFGKVDITLVLTSIVPQGQGVWTLGVSEVVYAIPDTPYEGDRSYDVSSNVPSDLCLMQDPDGNWCVLPNSLYGDSESMWQTLFTGTNGILVIDDTILAVQGGYMIGMHGVYYWGEGSPIPAQYIGKKFQISCDFTQSRRVRNAETGADVLIQRATALRTGT